MGGGKMDVYIAEPFSRKETKENINVYIAGEHPCKNGKKAFNWKSLSILESYYYLRNNKEFPRLIQSVENFLLDSGAFTFLMQNKTEVDWEKYVEEYADFINKYDIKLFFELDIDSIVGLQEVERLRDKLEELTGKKSIPVWHKKRGKEYFIQMCQNYPYVALGGIVIKEIPRKVFEQMFPWFIDTAHKYNTKIHGLGYTSVKNLKKYHFDSVDSTSWLAGCRSGFIYRFNPLDGTMEQIKNEKGGKLKPAESAVKNLQEWIKLQRWAKKNL